MSQLPQVEDDEDGGEVAESEAQQSISPSDMAIRAMLTFGLLCALLLASIFVCAHG